MSDHEELAEEGRIDAAERRARRATARNSRVNSATEEPPELGGEGCNYFGGCEPREHTFTTDCWCNPELTPDGKCVKHVTKT